MLKNFLFKRKTSLLFLLVAGQLSVNAQDLPINPKLLKGDWNAHWITCPGVPAKAYGVYHFRKTFGLREQPSRFIIHVSADNRYVLFVNGKEVGRGPARSSLYNWNFGTYDISSFLKAGRNVIAALVWNMGEYAPVAQISAQTGFLLQADKNAEEVANSDNSWKVLHDTAYAPCATNMGAELHTYMVVGPGDEVHANAYPWNWEEPGYNDSAWQNAEVVNTPVVTAGYGSDNIWTLAPGSIPQMEEKMQRMAVVRSKQGNNENSDFLKGGNSLTVAAHSKISILIDQSFETIGYPVLKVSGGNGSKIKLTYAEALFDSKGQKGNRNVVEGKTMKGLYDIFYPDGGKERSFSPLWLRTWRYIQLDIETGDEPLTLDDLYGIYTGYPFVQKASFASNDSSLEDIWKVGWRTARLCAGETYFDCPYYEQLQYEGDTRIQSLISLYNTGDDRLMRKAINDFYISRVPTGLTQGRFPSSRLQVIPPFSLFWVSMLHDYWMIRQDDAFLNKYLDAANLVLKWYEQHIDPANKMLGPMDWWSFVDWNDAFPGGTPPGANDGHSAVISLQYAYTLRQAAQLFNYFGRKEDGAHYLQLANELSKSVYQHCFDKTKMEMANTPEKNSYSQHASIMAILADAIPAADEQKVMKNILYDTSLSQATFYYRFYLTRAMVKAGMADLYYSQLTPWRDMLKIGLTTFAEKPDPTRSDCHAWSASPEYDFLATICGIMPDAPGFKKVRIEPALGELTEVKGTMPVPDGMITVTLTRKNKNGIEGEIILPGKLTGRFIWNGKEIALHGGRQKVSL
ncbi:MAG: alpha-L-rhamnosidase N-terminal domain-containing protein [Bacteroidota bacterium]|nr:alpha-L-rhamnosidase N-terminal domain-containing protein [Bacteroidota bacterium]